MKRNLMLSAVSALLLGSAALPAAASNCPGFLPPNTLNIPVGSADDKGILEEQFNNVLDTIQRLYGPEIAARGGVLQINRLWTDGTVNASAQQSGNKYILNMYGGLARHDAVTMDGFALVVCHELGHHLGGAPKLTSWYGNSWASIEGQSDYYANLKCLRRVFSDPASENFTRTRGSDETAQKACNAAFAKPEDRAICVRSTMAGKSVAYLFKALHNDSVVPGYDSPDTSVVSTMYTQHPATQCRMDTYLQGSICRQPVSAKLSETDPAAGTCTRSGGFDRGFRPLCWYKPANPAELLPPGSKVFGEEDGLPASFRDLAAGPAW